MKISARSLGHGIILVETETPYQLASSFMRMQEFYESPFPDIRGQYFEEIEFMDHYAENNDGVFSYFDDWAGFNVPGNIIEEFVHVFTGNLNKKEVGILSVISALKPENAPYYVLGALKEDLATLKHEIAHALYYLVPTYKADMTKLTSALTDNMKQSLCKYLGDIGYDKEVFDDEIQAYLSTSSIRDLNEFNVPLLTKHRQKFKKVFEKYVENLNLG